jgi:EpsI family protein
MHSAGRLLKPVGQGVFLAVCLILILQAAASRVLSIPERDLPTPQLHKLPMQIEKWKASGEETLEEGTVEVLQPDDYILRNYVDEVEGASIGLFVTHFESLQNSFGPHAPRGCLPGAGWLTLSSKIAEVEIPGRGQSIPVNEYVFEKSGNRIAVVYWYQNDRDVWAEEFHAKLRLLPDLIRYRRSDVSLVRLVAPLERSAGNDFKNCVQFTQLVFPLLADCFGSVR